MTEWPIDLGPDPACITCGRATLVRDHVRFTGPAYGLRVTVEMNGLKCPVCGFQTIRRQMEDFMRRVDQVARYAWGDRLAAVLVARRRYLGRLLRARSRALAAHLRQGRHD